MLLPYLWLGGHGVPWASVSQSDKMPRIKRNAERHLLLYFRVLGRPIYTKGLLHWFIESVNIYWPLVICNASCQLYRRISSLKKHIVGRWGRQTWYKLLQDRVVNAIVEGDAKSYGHVEKTPWLSMTLSGVPGGCFAFLIPVPNLVFPTAYQ